MIRSGRRSFIGPGLADILCEHHEHTVGRDNCVSFEGKRLQIPAQTHRCHFIKARVRVHRFTPTGAWLCSTGRASSPSTSPTAPGWRTYAPRRPVPRWHAERPSVRSARLGIRPSQRLGSRATRLDNSLCPDVFALPPPAFAGAGSSPRLATLPVAAVGAILHPRWTPSEVRARIGNRPLSAADLRAPNGARSAHCPPNRTVLFVANMPQTRDLTRRGLFESLDLPQNLWVEAKE